MNQKLSFTLRNRGTSKLDFVFLLEGYKLAQLSFYLYQTLSTWCTSFLLPGHKWLCFNWLMVFSMNKYASVKNHLEHSCPNFPFCLLSPLAVSIYIWMSRFVNFNKSWAYLIFLCFLGFFFLRFILAFKKTRFFFYNLNI